MNSKETTENQFFSDRQIILSDEQFRNAVIEHVVPTIKSEQYIQDRDTFWNEKVEEGKKVGKEFWNGILYTYEGIDLKNPQVPVIKFGKCEYKDFIYKHNLRPEGIAKKYGKESLIKHCWVSVLPITSDGKLICGRKDKSAKMRPDVMAYISGELNADETEVRGLEDIKEHAYKELTEESYIKTVKESLSLVQINVTETHAEFQFMVQLGFASDEIDQYLPKTEFKVLIAMSLAEVKGFNGESLTEFKKLQNQIRNLTQPISRFLK